MNPLALFRRDHAADEAVIAAALDGMTIEPERTLLENDTAGVTKILAKRRDHARTLEHMIANYTEQLRQTRISIQAFEAAEGVLSDG